jgi:hypothetical protein
MKKMLPWATAVLIAAGLFFHWRLGAEVDQLRQSQAERLIRLAQLQKHIGALEKELAQAPPLATPPQPPSPPATATNLALSAKELNARRFLEQEVEAVRGLKFLHPVTYRTIHSQDLHSFLVKKVREEYTPSELRDYSRSLALIGLVPEDVDFEATIMEVLGEQVAAFYDQDSGQLFTFSDSTLTGNMDRMIVAHEVTHALQDQHFHIKKWPLKRKDNDDLVAASMAVLEGDATFAMAKVFARSLDWKTALTDLGIALTQNMAKYERAPRYFREMLLFPYQEGQSFIAGLYAKGGTALVNAAFQKPPTTTAQILHPEKFHPNREEPEEVAPMVVAEPGWRQMLRNVVGEQGVGVLLREFGRGAEAATIAAGWRGDRYVSFETADASAVLFWRSAWASAAAARRFADAYRDTVLKRNTLRKPPLTLETRMVDRIVDLTLRAPRLPSAKAASP